MDLIRPRLEVAGGWKTGRVTPNSHKKSCFGAPGTSSGDENAENGGFLGLEGRKMTATEARRAKNGSKRAKKAGNAVFGRFSKQISRKGAKAPTSGVRFLESAFATWRLGVRRFSERKRAATGLGGAKGPIYYRKWTQIHANGSQQRIRKPYFEDHCCPKQRVAGGERVLIS